MQAESALCWLRAWPRRGYHISAVAGESAASRTRIETLLPGVHVDKPTAVAKACDLLLLTVPDDSLDNVVRMLTAAGALRTGQYVIHTSGRHGLAVLGPPSPSAHMGSLCIRR